MAFRFDFDYQYVKQISLKHFLQLLVEKINKYEYGLKITDGLIQKLVVIVSICNAELLVFLVIIAVVFISVIHWSV